jgi:hypothetical protein
MSRRSLVSKTLDEVRAVAGMHPSVAFGYKVEAMLMAAAYAPKGIARLVQMIEAPGTKPEIRHRSIELLLGYGLGKPAQQVNVDLTNAQTNGIEAVNAALATLVSKYGAERLMAGLDADLRTLEHQADAA